MDLNEAREEINRADEALVDAFVRRMNAVTEVARYKKAHGLPILDRSREEAVLDRAAALAGDELGDSVRALYEAVFEISRAYQTRLMDDDERKAE